MKGTEFVETSALNLPPIEGGDVQLGGLWDCHSSSFLHRNIFSTLALSSRHLEALPTKLLDYNLVSVTSSQSKRNVFHVSAEASFDLLGGLLAIGGGVSFDKNSTAEAGAEEFVVHYKLATYTIRVKGGGAQVLASLVDPEVKGRIVSGEFGATHYIAEVTLGGSATASLTVTRQLSDSLFELKGHLEGSLNLLPIVCVPITIGIKLGLGMLDKEGASSYSKTIKFESAPPILGAGPLLTIQDMFTRVESIDKAIRGYSYAPFDPSLVYGVPVAFKLRPINELFETGRSPMVRQLEENLKEEFLQMLLTANDYVGPNYVSSSLCRSYRPLVLLFTPPWAPSAPNTNTEPSTHNAGSVAKGRAVGLGEAEPLAAAAGLRNTYAHRTKNPLTQEILEYEEELQVIAASIRASGLTLMQAYRKGKASSTDLAKTLAGFHAQLEPGAIKAKLVDFQTRGRTLLLAVHLQDVEPGSLVQFLKSEQEVRDWLNVVRPGSTKLLLTTGGGDKLDSSIFSLFFALSRNVSAKEAEFGIAYPNTLPYSWLSLNFEVDGAASYTTQHDIQFALQLLFALADSQLVRTSTTGASHSNLSCGRVRTTLFRLFAQVAFGGSSFRLDLPRFHATHFDPFRDIGLDQFIICETYVQLLDALNNHEPTPPPVSMTTTTCLNLVLPIQSVESAYDQIQAYSSVSTFLGGLPSPPRHKWIAGFFSYLGSPQPAPSPLLLVFHGSRLLAVCLDRLDLQIFMNEIQQQQQEEEEQDGVLSGLDVLCGTKMAEHCWNHVHATVGLHLLEYIANEKQAEPRPVQPPPAFMSQPPAEQNAPQRARFETAQQVLRFVALLDLLSLLTLLTWLALAPFPELVPLVTRLSDGHWSVERGWIGFSKVGDPWIKLREGVQQFFSKQQETGTKKRLIDGVGVAVSCLDQLFHGMAEFMLSPNETLLELRLWNIARDYVRAAFVDEQSSCLVAVLRALERGQLFEAASLLAKADYNSSLHQVRDQLHSTSRSLDSSKYSWDSSLVRPIIEVQMAEFSRNKHLAVWLNPKWRYVMGQARIEESEALVNTLQKQHWPMNNTGRRLPTYLPQSLIERISEQIAAKASSVTRTRPAHDSVRAWTNWRSLAELRPVLLRAYTRAMLPRDFMLSLQQSLTAPQTLLRTELSERSLLLHWNANEECLEEPWGLDTVATILQKLRYSHSHLLNSTSPEYTPKTPMEFKIKEANPTKESPESIQTPLHIHSGYRELLDLSGGLLKRITLDGATNSILSSKLMYKPRIEPLSHSASELSASISSILPWVVQRLQLGDFSSIFDSAALLSLVPYPWMMLTHPQESPHQLNQMAKWPEWKATGFHMGRDDLWALLISALEPWLLRKVLRFLQAEVVPVPLLCLDFVQGQQDLQEKKAPRPVFPLFVSPSLLYSLPSCAGSGGLRTIVCVRHYDKARRPMGNARRGCGKTAILNKVLRLDNQRRTGFMTTTTTSDEGSSYGRSITTRLGGGFVELVHLDADNLYNNEGSTLDIRNSGGTRVSGVVRVINVHGDVLDPYSRPHLRPALRWLLSSPPSSGSTSAHPVLLVFWNVGGVSEFRTKLRELEADVCEENNPFLEEGEEEGPPRRVRAHHVFLDPSPLLRTAATSLQQHVIVTRVLQQEPEVELERFRSVFSRIVSTASSQMSDQCLSFKSTTGFLQFGIRSICVPPISPAVSSLVAYIEQVGTDKVNALLGPSQHADEDRPIWTELSSLVRQVFRENNDPAIDFSQLSYLQSRLQEVSTKATVGVRGRLGALRRSNGHDKEWTVEMRRCAAEVERYSVRLENLFRPFLEDKGLGLGSMFGKYLGGGNEFRIPVSTGTNPWTNPILELCLKSQPTTSDRHVPVSVVSIISPTGFGGVTQTLAGLVANIFPGSSSCCSEWLLPPGSLRVHCFHGHASTQLIIEWTVGGDRSAHLLMASILSSSHLTLLCCPTTLDSCTWTQIENLLELPLAAVSERLTEHLGRAGGGRDAMDPNLVLLVPSSPQHDSAKDEWSQRAQNFIRRLEEFQTTTTKRHALNAIQDRIYQNTFIQSIPSDGEGIETLHALIFGGGTRRPSGPADWLHGAQNAWNHLAVSTSLQDGRSLASTLAEAETRRERDALRNLVDAAFNEHGKVLDEMLQEKLVSFALVESNAMLVGLESVLEELSAALDATVGRCVSGPDGLSPCEECNRLIVGQEQFLTHWTKTKDGRLSRVLKLREERLYVARVRDALGGRLAQMCRAAEMRVGRSEQLDRTLRGIWNEERGAESAANNKTAWTRFRCLVCSLDAVVPPYRMIVDQVRVEYGDQMAEFLQNNLDSSNLPELTRVELPHFMSLEGLSARQFVTSTYESPFRSQELRHAPKLSWHQRKWLEVASHDFVATLLNGGGGGGGSESPSFFGLVRQCKSNFYPKLVEQFLKVWKATLGPNVVDALQHRILVLLIRRLTRTHEEWRLEHSAIKQLERKRDEFPNIFSTIVI